MWPNTVVLISYSSQATPESITRDMIESFEAISTGKWRVVYIEDCSTSFGFGSLFGDVSAGEVELGNDGSVASKELLAQQPCLLLHSMSWDILTVPLYAMYCRQTRMQQSNAL